MGLAMNTITIFVKLSLYLQLSAIDLFGGLFSGAPVFLYLIS